MEKPMIYTVTLNPALDRAITVEDIKFDDLNRMTSDVRYAGGKGIDVSRVIKELGGESIALGFLGGYGGLELQGRLINEGIICDFVKIAEETRTNIIVNDESSGNHMLLSATGPRVRPQDVGEIFNKLSTLTPKPSYVGLSGSLPRDITPNIYTQLIKVITEQGGKAVLDTDNEPLRLGIKATPYMIKPNKHELGRLINKEIKGPDEAVSAARKLNEMGIHIVAMSMGKDGLIVVTKDVAFQCISPNVKVKSTVGAGDSLLAGLILGLEDGKPLKDAAILGTAAGTATVMTPGTELCHKEDVERLIKRIKVKRL
jgi:6-phosphofructokinase 2